MRAAWPVLLYVAALAQAQDVGLVTERYYSGLIDRGEATGAAFASLERGEVTSQRYFGAAKETSLWRAASVTKIFTALAIARLVKQGKLDLDADVNQYLRTLQVPAYAAKPITIRHLLTHTSGLDDTFVGSAFLDSDGPQPPLAQTMRNWLPRRIRESGDVQMYANFGYGLLGAVLEDVTGERYESYMRREILEPLGMRDSTFEQPLPRALRDRVVPATDRTVFGRMEPAPVLYHRSTAGGGLTASLADLLRFLRYVASGRELPGDGFGFGTGTSRGEKYWSASGDLGGYHAVLLWFPEHDRALVTVAAGPSVNLCWDVVPKVMEAWFGAEKPPAKIAAPMPLADAKAVAARVAGTYRLARYPHHDLSKTFVAGWDRKVSAEPDDAIRWAGARWIATGPLTFRHESEDRSVMFQEDGGGRIRFLNREHERVAWYESGTAGVAFYAAFLLLAAGVAWFATGPLRWLASAVLLHSLAWLGAALIADPQRLILGTPWYLSAGLALGWIAAAAWGWLAIAAIRGRKILLLWAGVFALYFPFILMWNLV